MLTVFFNNTKTSFVNLQDLKELFKWFCLERIKCQKIKKITKLN